jgi:cation transport protein ChaC
VAFRIAAAQVFPELVLLWRREMVVGSYVPRWVTIRTHSHVFEAIAFTIDRQHPLYSGPLPLETTVQTLATACGLLGSCADYLHRTVEGLASVGVRDPSLLRLQQQVFAMQQQTGRVSCPR